MAVDNSNLVSLFSDIADAIRSKTGSASTIVADAFPAAIAAIPTGGEISGTYSITSNGTYDIASYASVDVNTGTNNSLFYDLVTNGMQNSPTYTDSTITSIKDYAFAYASNTSFNFPNCTTIGASCFRNATITEISMPKLESIADLGFYSTKLSYADFPSVTYIGTSAFANCTNISYASFPKCISIQQSAFNSCTNLASAYFPSCTYISSTAFNSNANLVNITFSSDLSVVGYWGFKDCRKLPSVSFPNLKTVQSYTFSNCYSLSEARFSNLTSIHQYAFWHCYRLTALYLTGSSVVALSSYAFTSTPIAGYSNSAGTFGSIYVPSSLYDSYIVATNWVTYASRFVSI